MSLKDVDEEKLESIIDELLQNVKSTGRRGIARVVYGRTIMYVLMLLLQIALLYIFVMRYSELSTYFFTISTVLSVIVVLVIINEEINPMYKLAWILMVITLPVFGTMTYLFVRFQPAPYLMRKNMDAFGGKTLPYVRQNPMTLDNVAAESKDVYNTARYLNATLNYPIYDNTQTEYFPLGELAFRKMLIELGKAEKFIFIEYFIVENGIMWDAVLAILEAKAKQGVEVRVMYDGTCCFSLLPHSYPKTLQKMGIKAKVFSPITPILSIHQNNRDHRKILVIDGEVAFTGGINFADEYINERERFGHWKDTAVMIRGNAVRSFTTMFLQMWNIGNKNFTDNIEKYISSSNFPNAKGYVIPYGDSPLDKENTGEQVYFDIINQARDYVYIMTPYLILDNEMLTVLKAAAKRGVDVRIIMPHIPDKRSAFYLARSYYVELISANVKIYEYTPGFVHGKMFLSDDEKAVVGTINLDYRSLFLHFECGMYMYKTDSVRDIRRDFDETFEKSMLIDKNFYYKTPVRQRIWGKILRLFAPMM